MVSNDGSRVTEPLPHMQSVDTLRDFIRAGYRTAECFAEIKSRNEAVRIARELLLNHAEEL